MMTELAPQSAHAAATIRHLYRPYWDFLILNEYGELEHALRAGGVVPLPADAHRFNLKPRVTGANPIGEKDLSNQGSYLSARAATIGCLFEVASRVNSGPIEVTSLVRHVDYQETLRVTNSNAVTSVPVHAMGMAFDIAVVNTPLRTVYEILDVLQQMSDAGDILFIAERHQLVFHVVPHPERLGDFAEEYVRGLNGGQSLASSLDDEFLPGAHVFAEVIDVRPAPEFAELWWDAGNVDADVAIEVKPQPVPGFGSGSWLAMVGDLLESTLDVVTRWTRT